MSYSVCVFGEIEFSKGKPGDWLACQVDPRRYDDWPRGFDGGATWSGKSRRPPTAEAFMKELASWKREGSFIVVKTRGERVTLRAFLEKSEFFTFRKHLFTLFRNASAFGATGEVAALGWRDAPVDTAYRGTIARGRWRFGPVTRSALSTLRRSDGYKDVEAQVIELTGHLERKHRVEPVAADGALTVGGEMDDAALADTVRELRESAPDPFAGGASRMSPLRFYLVGKAANALRWTPHPGATALLTQELRAVLGPSPLQPLAPRAQSHAIALVSILGVRRASPELGALLQEVLRSHPDEFVRTSASAQLSNAARVERPPAG